MKKLKEKNKKYFEDTTNKLINQLDELDNPNRRKTHAS
jgi:hypothetical protein